MVEFDRSEMGHQCDYERLRYCLALANEDWSVRVCHRARTPGDEPMAFRSSHGLQDALRYALRSQKAGVGSRIGPNDFDHRGAFRDALCVLAHCSTCDNNEREQ